MKSTRIVSSAECAVKAIAAPPHVTDAAYLDASLGGIWRGVNDEFGLVLLVRLPHLFGKLVPADPVAHPGADFPLERLWPRVDSRPELVQTLVDAVGIDLELLDGVADLCGIQLH